MRTSAHPTPRGLVAAVALALVAVFLGPAPQASASSYLVSAVNSERSSVGLPALREASDLTAVAQRWSQQMANAWKLYHNPDLSKQVTNWRALGENVGYGGSEAQVHSALMNSPGHRANILDRGYTEIGIGVVNAGGRVWVTQVFRLPADPTLSAQYSLAPQPVSVEVGWSVREGAASPGNPTAVFNYGAAGDTVLACDIDGDGQDSNVVYRNGTWALRKALGAGPPDMLLQYGAHGMVPICGDWDGDGKDTIGVYYGDTWYLRNSISAGSPDLQFRYGWRGATPVVGDWDGDGRDGIGVYSGGGWWLRNQTSPGVPNVAFNYGWSSARPVMGDWNGDGVDTVGVFHAGHWWLRNSNSPGVQDAHIGYGWSGSTPVVGDWSSNGIIGRDGLGVTSPAA